MLAALFQHDDSTHAQDHATRTSVSPRCLCHPALPPQAVPLSARARRRNGPSALHSRTAALRAGSPAPSAGPDTPRSFTSFGSGLLYAGAGPPPDDAVSFATDAGVPLRSDAASRGADDGRMGIGELGGSGNGSTTRTRPDSSRSSRPAQRGAPRHEPGLLAAAADAVVVSTPRGPQVHVTPRHSDAASGFAGGAPQPRPAATGTHSFHDVAPPHQASLHVDTATGPSDGNSTVSAAVAAAWGEAERTPRGLARPSSVASHTHSSWAKQRKAMPRRRRHGRSKPPPASRAGGSGSTRTKAAGAGARAGRAGARATGGPAQPRHRSSSTPRSILKTSTSATPRTPRTPGTFGTARTGRGESSAPPNRLTGSRPGPRHTCKVPAPVSDGWKPAGSSACSVCDARQRLFGTTTKVQGWVRQGKGGLAAASPGPTAVPHARACLWPVRVWAVFPPRSCNWWTRCCSSGTRWRKPTTGRRRRGKRRFVRGRRSGGCNSSCRCHRAEWVCC